MMAAMMLPSVSPTVALFSRMRQSREPASPLLFTAGYLVTWGAAGALAFAVAVGGRHLAGGLLDWDRAGRWVAGATLLAAAVYELTPLKDVCLGKCRSPLGYLLTSWRGGRLGGPQMGAENGLWCGGWCLGPVGAPFSPGGIGIALAGVFGRGGS